MCCARHIKTALQMSSKLNTNIYCLLHKISNCHWHVLFQFTLLFPLSLRSLPPPTSLQPSLLYSRSLPARQGYTMFSQPVTSDEIQPVTADARSADSRPETLAVKLAHLIPP